MYSFLPQTLTNVFIFPSNYTEKVGEIELDIQKNNYTTIGLQLVFGYKPSLY